MFLDNCQPNEYACDDGTCKAKFTWCDGVEDCADASDERADCREFHNVFMSKLCMVKHN